MDTNYLLWNVVIFAEIIVDRVLYLKSSQQGKKCLLVVTVVFYHMTFMTYYKLQCPSLNGSTYRHNLIACFYLMRCFYWMISAVQV